MWFGDDDEETESHSVAWKIVSKVREAQWAEKFAAVVKKPLAESGEVDEADTHRE